LSNRKGRVKYGSAFFYDYLYLKVPNWSFDRRDLGKKGLLPEVIKSRIQNELPKNLVMILPAVIKNIRKKNRREPYLAPFWLSPYFLQHP